MLANYTMSYPRTFYLVVSFICISICVAVFGMPNRGIMVNTVVICKLPRIWGG